MDCDTSRYERLFDQISKVRKKLSENNARTVLDDYLGYLLELRDLDYGLRLDDVILEASEALWRLCVALIRNHDIGNDTCFTRMARAYIEAHPLHYTVGTQAQIYSWMLFPFYFSYIIEDDTEDEIRRILYGRQYRSLCKLVGKDEMDLMIERFDEAFLLRQAKEIEFRTSYDQMMALLTKWIEETNCRLYELLLDRPELLDYQWLRTYQENEKEKEQGE